jgi:hypothetical protein
MSSGSSGRIVLPGADLPVRAGAGSIDDGNISITVHVEPVRAAVVDSGEVGADENSGGARFEPNDSVAARAGRKRTIRGTLENRNQARSPDRRRRCGVVGLQTRNSDNSETDSASGISGDARARVQSVVDNHGAPKNAVGAGKSEEIKSHRLLNSTIHN